MRRLALVALLALSATGLAQARDVVPAERRILPWDAQIPACQDPKVLADITAAFASREDKFWTEGLRLVGYEHVRPVAWRPDGLDLIPRRFCTAVALVNDGRKRRVDYTVREDLGLAGFGWDVSWCVHGLDRHWANAPGCRMERP
jgi:opacity protein-like surface antigen